MNNNYKIYGLISSLIRNDNPPKVSRDFSDNVMKKISSGKTSLKTNNYYNVAASIFFAVITAYSLISFERSNTNVVSVDTIDNKTDDNELIKRVKDNSTCFNAEESTKENDDNCK
tara:strand:- start:384 stop:728 length:345 start_codon:yes stop_codon:yes gene_type:complete